jgi:hypothetical protein
MGLRSNLFELLSFQEKCSTITLVWVRILQKIVVDDYIRFSHFFFLHTVLKYRKRYIIYERPSAKIIKMQPIKKMVKTFLTFFWRFEPQNTSNFTVVFVWYEISLRIFGKKVSLLQIWILKNRWNFKIHVLIKGSYTYYVTLK